MPELTHIESESLIVEVSSLGAEMQSLTGVDGRSYLWDGDAAWWAGRSPILFPIVGKAPSDRLAIGDFEAEMKQHGFARRSTFTLASHTKSACRHELVASDETKAVYPFDFRLALEHRLDGATLSVTAEVTNLGDAVMPFGIGFHPAFRWPLPGAEGRAHSIMLTNGAEPALVRLTDGLIDPQTLPSPFANGWLELASEMFAADAMIFPEGAGEGLVYGTEDGPALHFRFENLPNLALWQKPGAPFICIEPWHGMAAHSDGTAQLVERPYIVALAGGETMRFGFSVEIAG